MAKAKGRQNPYEKESIFRTLGAEGISINNELEKKDMRLLASKFDGTSIADSLTVSNRYSLLICKNSTMYKLSKYKLGINISSLYENA